MRPHGAGRIIILISPFSFISKWWQWINTIVAVALAVRQKLLARIGRDLIQGRSPW
jgi:hypothetical protein